MARKESCAGTTLDGHSVVLICHCAARGRVVVMVEVQSRIAGCWFGKVGPSERGSPALEQPLSCDEHAMTRICNSTASRE